MQITIKRKEGATWKIVPTDIRRLAAKDLTQYIGQPVVIEFAEHGRKIYGIGSDAVSGAWTNGKATMSMESFQDYWSYKMLEIAIDTLAAAEYRKERVAIMTTDGKATEQQAHAHCNTQPMLYGEQP